MKKREIKRTERTVDADCKHTAAEAEESMFRSSRSYQFTPVASCLIHLTRVIEANTFKCVEYTTRNN